MPVIEEETHTMGHVDDFFDFDKATGNVPDLQSNSASLADSNIDSFPYNETAVHEFDGNVLHQTGAAEYQAEDYSHFQDWIPRFIQPDEPCDYCRSRKLHCYMSYEKVTCTACDNLFRQCSFANFGNQGMPQDHKHQSGLGVIDTLHIIGEDVPQEQGAMTGIKTLRSKESDASKKSNPRFSRTAIKVLKEWMAAHPDSPYPTEDEKSELCAKTGLRYGQVNTWLANARRRTKLGKPLSSRPHSPSRGPATPAIGIPQGENVEVTSWSSMNPLERWKHSPPQNEPAPIYAIKDALDRADLPAINSSTPSDLGYSGLGSSRNSSHSNRRAPSMSSVEQLTSISSSSAAWSGSHESFGSFGSFNSGLHGKRDRRRRRKLPQTSVKKRSEEVKRRAFQCTFCTDTFKSKYDWSRHEKTLHLSMEKFICCPFGGEVLVPETGKKICAYCNSPDPTSQHLEGHGHYQCIEKGLDSRTFYRKDHLRQHLRLMHECELLPHMDAWKVEAKFINSRCGFCEERFEVWQERVDHIAEHFKKGKKMSEWKGCRGLDPDVAANVLNAMPPYLIGFEQTSLNPFSASSPKRMENAQHVNGPPATIWEILTVRLGRFVKEQTQKGVVLSDEALQKQARLILYDDDDEWNSTAADNPEWLDLFKRAHGLGWLPNAVGGKGSNVPEDLEMYQDLGVRIPFSVQLAHVNKAQDVDSAPEEVQDLEYSGDLGMRVPFVVQLARGANPENIPAAAVTLFRKARERRAETTGVQEQHNTDETWPNGYLQETVASLQDRNLLLAGPQATLPTSQLEEPKIRTYTAYEEVPIPADKLGHFLVPPNNSSSMPGLQNQHAGQSVIAVPTTATMLYETTAGPSIAAGTRGSPVHNHPVSSPSAGTSTELPEILHASLQMNDLNAAMNTHAQNSGYRHTHTGKDEGLFLTKPTTISGGESAAAAGVSSSSASASCTPSGTQTPQTAAAQQLQALNHALADDAMKKLGYETFEQVMSGLGMPVRMPTPNCNDAGTSASATAIDDMLATAQDQQQWLADTVSSMSMTDHIGFSTAPPAPAAAASSVDATGHFSTAQIDHAISAPDISMDGMDWTRSAFPDDMNFDSVFDVHMDSFENGS